MKKVVVFEEKNLRGKKLVYIPMKMMQSPWLDKYHIIFWDSSRCWLNAFRKVFQSYDHTVDQI